MTDWVQDSIYLFAALVLVVLNGFFVAAEFALVKIRGARVQELVDQGRPFSRTVAWLNERQDGTLSACQLGITMASLGLGWIGEPAFARLLEPLLGWMGITSAAVVHTVGFLVAFTLITALHLVIGEQAPKIFAIRKPEQMMLWCAAPMKFFYIVFYPFLVGLNKVTAALLRRVGVDGDEHETPHTEAEIRALITDAHARGELTRAEHKLAHAIFEFDDMICRRIMVPRADIVAFDLRQPLAELLDLVRDSRHTRYPVHEGSLDSILGIAHIKDLVGVAPDADFDLRAVLRPPRRVPETMPISRLLRHFQATHDLMAFVVDEYANMIGFVTLENVLEQIVGPVDDEFDQDDEPEITKEADGRYLIAGSAPLDRVRRELGLKLSAGDVDTLSGLLTTHAGHVLAAGETVSIPGLAAEVLEVDGARVTRVRVTVAKPPDPS